MKLPKKPRPKNTEPTTVRYPKSQKEAGEVRLALANHPDGTLRHKPSCRIHHPIPTRWQRLRSWLKARFS